MTVASSNSVDTAGTANTNAVGAAVTPFGFDRIGHDGSDCWQCHLRQFIRQYGYVYSERWTRCWGRWPARIKC